jgi:hypothetical protein
VSVISVPVILAAQEAEIRRIWGLKPAQANSSQENLIRVKYSSVDLRVSIYINSYVWENIFVN